MNERKSTWAMWWSPLRLVGLGVLLKLFNYRSSEFERVARECFHQHGTYTPVRIFDTEFAYGPEAAKEILATLKHPGIEGLYFWTQLSLDLAFPLLYTYSFYKVVGLMQRPSMQRVAQYAFLTAGPADVIENIFSVILLEGDALHPNVALVFCASAATMIKTLGLALGIILLLSEARWLQRAYVARLPLFALVVLFLVFPSWTSIPTVRNFGILEGGSEQFWAPVSAVMVAGVLLTTWQLCWFNGTRRLNMLKQESQVNKAAWWQWLVDRWTKVATPRKWLRDYAFTLSALLACVPMLIWFRAMNYVNTKLLLAGAFAGCAIILGSIKAGNALALLVEPRVAPRVKAINPNKLDAEPQLPDGYENIGAHVRAFFTVACFFGIQFVLYCTTAPGGWPFPTIGYVVFLVGGLCAALAGVSFFTDRHRIPIVLIAVVVGTTLSALFKRDHTFDMAYVQEPSKRPSITDHFDRRFADEKKPVIVIATTGGGIQAAAWTTHVLAQLEARFGPQFRESVALISGASGGSVGSYFWIESTRYDRGLATPAGAIKAHCAARASSLQATAWGLAFPDTWALWDERDRGRALEQAWLDNMSEVVGIKPFAIVSGGNDKRQPASMSEWSALAGEGRLPAVLFNSILVESGELLGLSNVDWGTVSALNQVVQGKTRAMPFRSLESAYPEFPKQEQPKAEGASNSSSAWRWEMPAVTAARLSATFPYVTPVSHPKLEGVDKTKLYHVADGGYFDNLGVVGAVSYLSVLADAGKLAGRRVVLIRIESFPEGDEKTAFKAGLPTQTKAPVFTLLNARTTTQQRRSQVELELLRDALESKDATYSEVTLRPPEIPPYAPGAPVSWQLDGCSLENLRTDFEAQWEPKDTEDKVKTLLEKALRWSADANLGAVECSNEPKCTCANRRPL